MKNLITALLFLFPYILSAQNGPLFRIVCASEGVEVDRASVSAGSLVYAPSKRLIIPGNGYAGILTSEGYAFKLTRSIDVDDVSKFVFRKSSGLRKSGKLITSMHKPKVDEGIEMMGLRMAGFNKLAGDSLLLFWIDRMGDRKPYIIRAGSDYGRHHWGDTVSTNWKLYRKKDLLGNGAISLIEIIASGSKFTVHTPQYFLYAKPSDLQLLKKDLSKIQPKEIDAEVMRMVIYEIHGYSYDNLFHWFKWVRANKTASGDFAQDYLNAKAKTYQLDQFNFRKTKAGK